MNGLFNSIVKVYIHGQYDIGDERIENNVDNVGFVNNLTGALSRRAIDPLMDASLRF